MCTWTFISSPFGVTHTHTHTDTPTETETLKQRRFRVWISQKRGPHISTCLCINVVETSNIRVYAWILLFPFLSLLLLIFPSFSLFYVGATSFFSVFWKWKLERMERCQIGKWKRQTLSHTTITPIQTQTGAPPIHKNCCKIGLVVGASRALHVSQECVGQMFCVILFMGGYTFVAFMDAHIVEQNLACGLFYIVSFFVFFFCFFFFRC